MKGNEKQTKADNQASNRFPGREADKTLFFSYQRTGVYYKIFGFIMKNNQRQSGMKCLLKITFSTSGFELKDR